MKDGRRGKKPLKVLMRSLQADGTWKDVLGVNDWKRGRKVRSDKQQVFDRYFEQEKSRTISFGRFEKYVDALPKNERVKLSKADFYRRLDRLIEWIESLERFD